MPALAPGESFEEGMEVGLENGGLSGGAVTVEFGGFFVGEATAFEGAAAASAAPGTVKVNG